MTMPNFQVQPTPQGFAITAGSKAAEFAFGSVSGNGGYGEFDVVRSPSGFSWSPQGLAKLRVLGLHAGFKADGAPIAQPDPIPFLIVAGIVQAPQPAPAPATKKVAATLEQIKFLPGAKEFPEAVSALAEAGSSLEEAQSILGFALRDSAKNSPNRSCNSQFGLILHQVPN